VIDEVTEREDPLCGGTTRMVAMEGFDHLLNWKLKRGSHYFPGPDGGTCINEAAIVAAGFKYRPISSAWDMPKCFSRPICELAMQLNDEAGDEERQRLLPYVTRLACADTPEIELLRATYIHRRMRTYHHFTIPFDEGLEVLEGALAIGRQADPLRPDEVQTRMDAARAGQFKPTRAATPAPVPDTPFSKVKSWLTMKETEPAA
jgi:hypothetical protein